MSSRRLRTAAVALALFGLAAAPSPARAFVWPNVPEQIEKALASGDASERRLAAQRLIELPPEIGLKLVEKGLADPDVDVRLRVAAAAVALHMPKAGDKVMTWLQETDPRIRLAACDVIRAAPTDRSVVALGRVLGDPDAHVRFAAAAAMGSSGLSEAVSPLLGHLDDQTPEVRSEVARALGRIGDPRAVVPLIGKVQDSASDVRKIVARALGDLGDLRATQALMLALQDASQEVRLESVKALGKLKSDDATLSIASLLEPQVEEQPQSYPGYYPGYPRRQDNGTGNEVRTEALRALGRIGSEAAVKVLVGALAKDPEASATRSAVREALVSAGKPAVSALVTLLNGSPSPSTAAGAALVLGALKAKEAATATARAMQRGALEARAGLRALAQIGASDALPTVLERIDDADPAVRREATLAAMALLEPGKIDGRPVDPAIAALKEPGTPADEKIDLVRLLGKTKAPRAQAALLPLVEAKPVALRVAVLDALGEIGSSSADIDKALLKALEDESADVRFTAAVALSRVASADVAAKLLKLLAEAAEQDRSAIGIALSGALARTTDAAVAARVAEATKIAPDVARDALIEGLGRMKGDAAGKALAGLSGGTIDDRRKVAEALAGHANEGAALKKLADDADPGVRAAAVWSLGAVAGKDAIASLADKIKDPDVAVAGDAAGAIGRVAAREKAATEAQGALCPALVDPRPYVRANAVTGLALAGGHCDGDPVRDLLARDPSESVRLAAAQAIGRAVAIAGAKAVEADKRALVRCASEDRNAGVATRCTKPFEALEGAEDVAVYVVADLRSQPTSRAPFTVVRPDGLLHLGLADRRGEVFERGVERGTIKLGVPAALAR